VIAKVRERLAVGKQVNRPHKGLIGKDLT